MTTVLDLLTGSARLLGVIRKGESLDADEASDALDALNEMIESWSNNTLIIYGRVTETFTLSAATSFTIGSGGTFNTTKPVKLIDAYVSQSGIDYPLIEITQEEYNDVSSKSLGSMPRFIFYDNGHPLGKIYLYPKPSASYTLTITSEKALTTYTDYTTSIDLPAGFKEAIRYNLAIKLAPEFGVSVSQEVVINANKSMGNIKRAVARSRPLVLLPSDSQEGNIYTGYQ